LWFSTKAISPRIGNHRELLQLKVFMRACIVFSSRPAANSLSHGRTQRESGQPDGFWQRAAFASVVAFLTEYPLIHHNRLPGRLAAASVSPNSTDTAIVSFGVHVIVFNQAHRSQPFADALRIPEPGILRAECRAIAGHTVAREGAMRVPGLIVGTATGVAVVRAVRAHAGAASLPEACCGG